MAFPGRCAGGSHGISPATAGRDSDLGSHSFCCGLPDLEAAGGGVDVDAETAHAVADRGACHDMALIRVQTIERLAFQLFGQTGEQADMLSDLIKAYGPVFYHLVLLLAAGVLLSVAIRRSTPVYAAERQKLRD